MAKEYRGQHVEEEYGEEDMEMSAEAGNMTMETERKTT